MAIEGGQGYCDPGRTIRDLDSFLLYDHCIFIQPPRSRSTQLPSHASIATSTACLSRFINRRRQRRQPVAPQSRILSSTPVLLLWLLNAHGLACRLRTPRDRTMLIYGPLVRRGTVQWRRRR